MLDEHCAQAHLHAASNDDGLNLIRDIEQALLPCLDADRLLYAAKHFSSRLLRGDESYVTDF